LSLLDFAKHFLKCLEVSFVNLIRGKIEDFNLKVWAPERIPERVLFLWWNLWLGLFCTVKEAPFTTGGYSQVKLSDLMI
jgi:hypothetical protein